MKLIVMCLFLMTWACQNNTVQNDGTMAAQTKPMQIIVPANCCPVAHVGVFYSLALSVTGGKQPYKWSIVQGALPPGLRLTSTGNGKNATISGTPTSTGSYSFTALTVDGKKTVAKLQVVQP